MGFLRATLCIVFLFMGTLASCPQPCLKSMAHMLCRGGSQCTQSDRDTLGICTLDRVAAGTVCVLCLLLSWHRCEGLCFGQPNMDDRTLQLHSDPPPAQLSPPARGAPHSSAASLAVLPPGAPGWPLTSGGGNGSPPVLSVPCSTLTVPVLVVRSDHPY